MRRKAVMSAALAAALLCRAGEAAEDAKPLPVDRTQILKNGGNYYVDGRVRIGKTTQIMVQKDTKIVGRNDAVIELEGQLALVGVSDLRVVLTDVTIELQPKFGDFRTDMVTFAGKSRGVVSAPDKAVDGRVFIQNTTFDEKATVDVTMCANEIDLQRVDVSNLVHVKAVDPPGAANKVKANFYNNSSGNGTGPVTGQLAGGLLVEHVATVIARGNVMAGDSVSFQDCGAVTFDENSVRSKKLEFRQSAPGRFHETTMSKCDVMVEKLVAFAPPAPDGKGETFTIVHSWFGGETKEKVVHEKFIADRAGDPTCGVTVEFTKLSDKPQGFAK